MTNYYFLASFLPELEIGHVPKLSFESLMDLIKINVTEKDQKIVQDFLRMIDMENFLRLWTGEPIDPRGNLDKEKLEQALDHRAWSDDEIFPFYLTDYLTKYQKVEDRILHFAELKSSYLRNFEEESGFVAEFAHFQRGLHLVMIGFRAKRLKRDLFKELQMEDPKDPIVAQILVQKDAKNFEPPFEYADLKPIFTEFADQPLLLHKALMEYQFWHIIENWGGELFSIERILNYLARLILVERWLEMDVQRGISLMDKMESEVR